MKLYFGIALVFVLGTQFAHGGGLGGFGGGGAGLTIRFDLLTRSLWVPGRLDEHFEINQRGYTADSDLTTYSMEADEFAQLQNLLDTRHVISAQGQDGKRSYRALSGEHEKQVEMIDRRAAIRSEVAE